MPDLQNTIRYEDTASGAKVELTFTDAAAPGVKKMIEGWLGVPAADGMTPSAAVTMTAPGPAPQFSEACPGCWRPVPTPHERDGVRLCDQEAVEIDSLRQFGAGTENAKLALRKLENWRTAAVRSGIRWEAPVNA